MTTTPQLRHPRTLHDRGILPPWLAITVSVTGGACSSAQALVNGRLGDDVGSPVTAALVSNGLATVILLGITLSMPSVRAGLRRLREARLPWWQYLGGCIGALSVAGTAYAAPRLGVALFTVALVAGTSFGGVASDRVGLGPVGKMEISWRRLGAALLAVAAVVIAKSDEPISDVAIGVLIFVLVLGFLRSAQVALNGRISQAVINVGSASMVNAVIGTTVLGIAAGLFAASGHLPFHGWPTQWWPYVGGILALVVTGANLVVVRTIGVLRTGLSALAGQLGGGLLLDAVVPGSVRPTIWLGIGVAVTAFAVYISNTAKKRPVRDEAS
jgi:transporter family-2 protein